VSSTPASAIKRVAPRSSTYSSESEWVATRWCRSVRPRSGAVRAG
jgi:hypothetical protein